MTTGAVAQRISYGPFGETTYEIGTDSLHPSAYAGGMYDAATQLYRFGARDYDPRIGRWTAKDPIRWEGGQWNLYEYVGGDAVNGVDPSGTGPLAGLVCSGGSLLAGISAAADAMERMRRIRAEIRRLEELIRRMTDVGPRGEQGCDPDDPNLAYLRKRLEEERDRLQNAIMANVAGFGGAVVLGASVCAAATFFTPW